MSAAKDAVRMKKYLNHREAEKKKKKKSEKRAAKEAIKRELAKNSVIGSDVGKIGKTFAVLSLGRKGKERVANGEGNNMDTTGN
jgi:ribosomal protein L9